MAFVRRKFAVDGFYSVTAAEDLVHDGRYDVIVVVSPFSHLSIEDWTPWLKRLYAMLNQDGVLLFSTLGAQDYSAVGGRAFEAKAEGFLYNPENETRGRLVGEHYGAAYVTEGYVEGVVSALPSARLLGYWPAALNHFQDVYVVQRVGVTAAQIFTSPPLSGSPIETRGQ